MRPARYASRPASTDFFIADAINTGSRAFAMAVFISTPSQPSSIAIAASDAVPILVDAGVGTASDAAIAMELGCDGVLMNTAIAGARDPILMAHAMKLAIEAGRAAFKAGRIPRKRYASASSPVDGLIG